MNSVEDTKNAVSLNEPGRRARLLGLVTVILAVASGIITFVILLGLTSIEPTEQVIQNAMLINSIFLVALIFSIGWEASLILLSRRKGSAGARLHIRIVLLFSLVAAVPTILVAIFATITLDRGLDRWFSSRTLAIINTSQTVAEAYRREHATVLRNELLGMAQVLNSSEPYFILDEKRFKNIMVQQANIRGLPLVFLVDSEGKQLVSSPNRLDQPPPDLPTQDLIKRAHGQPLLIALGNSNLVAGILKLDEFNDAFLFILRVIDPAVSNFLRMTSENVQEYRTFLDSRNNIQLAFGILYAGAGLIVVLSAIWIGIGFANRLVAPIRRLIFAADRVRQGDLFVRLPVEKNSADFSNLNTTFNTMTTELRSQRDELLTAKDLIDDRRRFTEAMLKGVTAGIIGVDATGKVTLANPSIQKILGCHEKDLLGQALADILPEIAPLVKGAEHETGNRSEEQVTIIREGIEFSLRVRVTSEISEEETHSYVVTLDDVTDLVSAQRSAAWADVARRIAHEIKNPLTPIQLSAERLRRRYGKKVAEDDRRVFDQCVNTIVRQVGDIGRMVDEFSSFARMPKPVFEPSDLSEMVRQSVFLIEVANQEISFETAIPDKMPGSFDQRLLSQAITNIVKNATEAIDGRENRLDEKGHILVRANEDGDAYCLQVIDNGIGLPSGNRARLLEPYMTTREKGTGLGLAIVRKILKEHGGSIQLRDAREVSDHSHGACVELRIPKDASKLADEQPEDGHHNSGLEGPGDGAISGES
ncbi:MAG: PAS domain-containing sensor histidine kinase [Cohaesibacter sp.]|jgi:two-component system nitrogen regulation sensor histidine kinase NtrY|nr:PAS domain-containing sensor histidine kinase [Cohaesibacter sp.]